MEKCRAALRHDGSIAEFLVYFVTELHGGVQIRLVGPSTKQERVHKRCIEIFDRISMSDHCQNP